MWFTTTWDIRPTTCGGLTGGFRTERAASISTTIGAAARHGKIRAFDYGCGEVGQYLRDNALRWLEQRFADGLRWDSVGSIRNVKDQNKDPADDIPEGWSLMQWINSLIGQRQPRKISIAEHERQRMDHQRYRVWRRRIRLSMGAESPRTVRGAITGQDDGTRHMPAVGGVIARTYNGNVFERVIYTESHDADSNGQSRIPEMIWPGNAASWFSKKRSKLGGDDRSRNPHDLHGAGIPGRWLVSQ